MIDIIRDEHRDQLYYKEYQYCSRVSVRNARLASYFNNIEDYCFDVLRWGILQYEYKTTWHETALSLASRGAINYPQLLNLSQLEKFIDWMQSLKQTTVDHRILLNGNSVSLFTNDLPLIESSIALDKGDDNIKVRVFNAVVPQIKSSGQSMDLEYPVRVLKNYKHKYRVYLKTVGISVDERNEFVKFIKNIPEGMYPSRSLSNWIDIRCSSWKSRFIPNTYIEYDEDYMLVHLQLMWGKYLGKSYLIEKSSG